MKVKVLFVCLGNICRSTMAEAILQHNIEEQNLAIETDSAGTAGYHIDAPPDHRTMAVLEEMGIEYLHKGRQLSERDFYYYDHILVMDNSNLEDVKSVEPMDAIAQISLVRKYDSEKSELPVPDPYYGGKYGFYKVYDLLKESIEGFLQSLKK